MSERRGVAGKGAGTLYIGVDPGVRGFAALLAPDGWVAFEPLARAAGKADLAGIVRQFRRIGARWLDGDLPYARCTVVLEEVHSMPRQGVASTFAFGRGFGRVEAAVVAAGLPLVYVRPAAWKKAILLASEREAKKAGSVLACERLFPALQLPTNQRGRIDDNACDALCLAEYGSRCCL
jgi:hypothetical protein